MPAELVDLIVSVLDSQFASRIAHSPEGRIQLTVHGLPEGLLQDLFDLMTGNGTSNHAIHGASGREVLILLVKRDPGARPSGAPALVSHACGWEGVVFARNSWPRLLALCSETIWGTVPESVENATEPLGPGNGGTEPRLAQAPIWKLVVEALASRYSVAGVSRDGFTWALTSLLNQSVDFTPVARRELPWSVLQRLAAGAPSVEEFFAAVGIPARTDRRSEVQDLRGAIDALDGFASFVDRKGLEDAFDQFRRTTAGAAVSAELDQFKRAIQLQRGLGVDFVEAPCWVFRAAERPSPWQNALTYDVLAAILAELNQSGPRTKARLSCTNALNRPEPLEGEPFLVLDSPEFEVSDARGIPLDNAEVVRGVGGTATRLAAPSGAPPVFSDPTMPLHERRTRYVAEAPEFARSQPLYVLSLSRFRCHATARVAEASANKPPALVAKTRRWRQRIVLPISGVSQVEILHDPTWLVSAVDFKGESPPTAGPESPERAVYVFKNVEDGDTAEITLTTERGAVSGWTLEFTIERNEDELPRSMLESLVAAHQHSGRVQPVAPRDTLLRSLETSYLGSSESWRPILAGWSGPNKGLGLVDWIRPVLGDLAPFPDVFPQPNPPVEVLRARESVRQLLRECALRVPEMDFSDPRWAIAISQYADAYGAWLKTDPGGAACFDVVAVFGAVENAEAGRYSPTQEPVAILLSPLHPLRIGWRAAADGSLRTSLSESHPCPAAGLIDPHVVPDAIALPLSRGEAKPQWRAFFSVGSDDVCWGLMFNRRFLDELTDTRRQIQTVLDWLGLKPRSMAGGFSPSQAVAALDEVVEILPARSTLRVGIAGGEGLSTSSVDGISTWAAENLGEEFVGALNPTALEVHDARRAPVSPSPGELTDLYDKTHERVQWYRHPDNRLPVACDLVVLDQLGFTDPEGAKGQSRSPATPDALTRVRLKEDFGEARWLSESRIIHPLTTPEGAASPIGRLCSQVEELTEHDEGVSHLKYHPNQEALGERLIRSTFLAVSSTRLDPACLIRGVQGRHGHLWDYALPAIISTEDQGSGYYLIAQPTVAMQRSVADATRVLGLASPPEATELLAEASHRGIPILKRLAAGGAESRGELGTLLAVRLLQDCFRTPRGHPRVPPISDTSVGLVLPIDPYASLFVELGKALGHRSRSRPDLLLALINTSDPSRPHIDLLPIEVKFRSHPLGAAEQDDALEQATGFVPLLKKLWEDPLPSRLWTTCARTVLANILDEAFRVYADPAVHGLPPDSWRRAHEMVLDSVMSGAAAVHIASAGRLLAFGGWGASAALDLDRDGVFESLQISTRDCVGLLLTPQHVSPDLERSFSSLLDISTESDGPVGPRPAVGEPPNFGGAEEDVHPVSVRADDAEPLPVARVAPNRSALPGTTLPDAAGDSGHDAPKLDLPQGLSPGTDPPVPPVSRVPQEKRNQVAAGFEGFIGNRDAVDTLTRDLLKALMESPPHLPKNFLFTGSPSTGKTELARRVAKVLGFPFVRIDGRGLVNLDRLTELLDNVLSESGRRATPAGRDSGLPAFDYPSSIVFVDEVHLVPRAVQEGLLLVLERNDRRGVLRDRVVLMNRVTFLFATTRASELDRAFKTRCTEIPLEEYTVDEVAQMIAMKHPGWDPAVYQSLAINGRMIPRVALELADTLVAELEVTTDPSLPVARHLQAVLRSRQIMDRGITPQDLDYLKVLARQDRPIGFDALVGVLGAADPARVAEEVEPFLVRLGFIKRGRGGREILPAGRAYLAEAHRTGQGSG